MLTDFVTKEDVLFHEACGDWEDAVHRGAVPLIRRGVIEESYVEAIKKNHRAMPYMVIAPGIMLAHARPECGAHGIGITLMTLAEPVAFGSAMNDPVWLVITLATPDEQSHLKMLEALTNFLMTPERLDGFLAAKNVEEAFHALRGED